VNKSKSLLAILVVLILGLGWYLLSEKSARDNPDSTAVYNDSVHDPERPVFTAQEDTVEQDSLPPRVGEELAPGTALVKATVIADDFDSKANGKLTVTAEEILGYGSATSPIGARQEMTINIERFLKRNPSDEELLQKGKTVFMVVSFEEGMSLGDSQGGKRWTLVEIKSQ
jgi:hypothetical protein